MEYGQYSYDLLNRLIAVRKNGTTVAEYGYDPEGLRVVRKIYTNGVQTDKIHYVFQGTEPIFEKRISDSRIRSYVYAGVKLIARVDGVIGSSAKKYWYHTDHLGSVKAVTKTDGTLAWKADYLPFGQQFGKSKIDPTFEEDDLGFTGKGFDADIGLYYFNARWYDADTGRFISEDPVADPNNPNLYSYVANNPLRYTDPTGLGADNPSDPGTMVGPTRPENATDYGGGGNSGGSTGQSSSGGQNNSGKGVPQSGPSTEESPSICAPVDGKDLTKDQPKTLSELKDQIEKDNPGAKVEIVDANTIIIHKGWGQSVKITGLDMKISGDQIIINKKAVTDGVQYFIHITKIVGSAGIGGELNDSNTATAIGASYQGSEVTLSITVTINSKGLVQASYTVGVEQGAMLNISDHFSFSNGTTIHSDTTSNPNGLYAQGKDYVSSEFCDVQIGKKKDGNLHINVAPPFAVPMVDNAPVIIFNATFDMKF